MNLLTRLSSKTWETGQGLMQDTGFSKSSFTNLAYIVLQVLYEWLIFMSSFTIPCAATDLFRMLINCL